MVWRRMAALVGGLVEREVLLRNEYLAAENRILRSRIKGRLLFTNPERRTLASIARKIGRKALESLPTIVTPDTLLAWHRRLVARKFDGSKRPRRPGRPPKGQEIEDLVVRLARENRGWGCHRISGAIRNLGMKVSPPTVLAILKRNGIQPAPDRSRNTTWAEFIRSHREVLAATDFFTVEVWTRKGLLTLYVLFFIHLASRRVHVAGITPYPTGEWMAQIARNETMEEWGFLQGRGYLLHDRDGKFCAPFDRILKQVGVMPVVLPAKSPNLNAYAERWVRSVKEECLSKLILFGEQSLRKALADFVDHFHGERNHQGKGNLLLFPSPQDRVGARDGPIKQRRRLGGLLNFYFRRAG